MLGMTSTLDNLLAERDRLRQLLALNEDFVAWNGLNELVQQMQLAHAMASKTKSSAANHQPPYIPPKRGDRKMSQIDYAIEALALKGRPLNTAALIPEIEKLGGRIGGDNPRMNLAGILSKSDRVNSIPWEGSRGWWPVDRPLPNAQRETAGAAIND